MWDSEHCGYRDRNGMSRIQQDLDQRSTVSSSSNSERDMLRAATIKGRPVAVGIVGAGFAGLRCADVLLQHGCKVTIFEARNRLGGRVAQSEHLGHRVDLGPNWIHGTENNPIMHLAKETGTELHAWDEEEAIIGVDGKVLDIEEAEQYSSLLWDDGLVAAAFRHSNQDHDKIDPQRSLYDFFAEKSNTLFTDEPEDVAKRKRETLLLVAGMWGAYIGSPVSKQSLKYYWLEECISGENPFVAGTYHRILDAVARPAREGAQIKLNTEVVRITAGDHGKPRIHSLDGDDEEFDEVVVTTPLGWLKRNRAAFSPPLTPRLSQAIENIGHGTLDKVYITFPSAFWDPSTNLTQSEPTAIHGSLDPPKTTPNVTATTSPLHQPRAEEQHPVTHYPGFTHWLAPNYAPDTNPHHWDPQAMNLAALPPNSAHPTLLFYIYGACSEHIANLTTTATSDVDRDAKLLAFFEPYYSRLPNYSAADPACTPKAVLATAWAADKFAGYGSYSNFQTGLEKGDEDIEVMRHGMPERGVWFAGEHTAPFVALGTSTGAYWAGEGVGKRIAKTYGLGGEVA